MAAARRRMRDARRRGAIVLGGIYARFFEDPREAGLLKIAYYNSRVSNNDNEREARYCEPGAGFSVTLALFHERTASAWRIPVSP